MSSPPRPPVVVERVEVFHRLLDGGPVVCPHCLSAWRPLARCPSCGTPLRGVEIEQATERAYALYRLQRRDEAPIPGGADWLPYLRARGFLPAE